MKVRDSLAAVVPAQTRLFAIHCRVSGEPDDSRISTQGLRAGPGILTAFDREFGLSDNYVHRRPIR